MKIYVASSWRNVYQPEVVRYLRALAHEVYDFRAGDRAFGWKEIDPKWQAWTLPEYREALDHPRAAEGYNADMAALAAARLTVLVCPCGRSAHLEFGAAVGRGQQGIIFLPEAQEPELMYRMGRVVTTYPELIQAVRTLEG